MAFMQTGIWAAEAFKDTVTEERRGTPSTPPSAALPLCG